MVCPWRRIQLCFCVPPLQILEIDEIAQQSSGKLLFHVVQRDNICANGWQGLDSTIGSAVDNENSFDEINLVNSDVLR